MLLNPDSRSVGIQTSSILTIANSVGTQSEDLSSTSAQNVECVSVIICTTQSSNKLPIIQLKIFNISLYALVDTGSSVSLLDENFLRMHKHELCYKNVSRSVKIATINSQVYFSGCISLTFRLDNKYFKHPVFLTPLKGKTFSCLLGLDFLTSNFVDIYNSWCSETSLFDVQKI